MVGTRQLLPPWALQLLSAGFPLPWVGFPLPWVGFPLPWAGFPARAVREVPLRARAAPGQHPAEVTGGGSPLACAHRCVRSLSACCFISWIISILPFPLSLSSLFIYTTEIPSRAPHPLLSLILLHFQMLIIHNTQRLRSGSRLFDLCPVIYFHLPAFKCYFRFTLTY